MPEIAQLQNLRELYLSGNQISSIPSEIAQLQNLSILNLGDNQITQEHQEKIKSWLSEKCYIYF
ncbi:leucine-rich repeat domain-containing protein [Candidatus Uabimicrobium sp. HlEnr_7]|uniref:leucine-rich repeat domain-containing protein n=1 Tax=Candidatus Uabimicrobium helgolandensis TaxID=3095367 RepID=UPI0035582B1E